MAKPELGVKRICLSCGAKFYDLGKDPAEEQLACPSCGADFDPEAAVKLKRGRVSAANDDKPKAQKEKAEDADESEESDEDDIDLDDDEDDGVLEDTSDLEDDEDVPAVVSSDKEEET